MTGSASPDLTHTALTEYHRLLRARSVGDASTEEELLRALVDLEDLLDRPALVEHVCKLEAGVSLLIVATAEPVASQTVAFLATVEGRVHALRVSDGRAGSKTVDTAWSAALDDFDPSRDRVLGLYATRGANPFRASPSLVVVVQTTATSTGHRIYDCPLEEPRPASYPPTGDRAPAWLTTCHIAAPPSRDLILQQPPVPPWNATCAVAIGEELWSSVFVRESDQRCAVDGLSISALGAGIVVVTGDQSLVAFEDMAAAGEGRPSWSSTLSWQPVCIAGLTSTDGEVARLLVASDAGDIRLLARVREAEVQELRAALVARLESRASLTSFADWIAWCERVPTGEPPARRLALLLEQALSRTGLDANDMDRLAHAFVTPLPEEALQPLLRVVRRHVRRWTTEACPGAAALLEVYKTLPYGAQAWFDLELNRLGSAEPSAGEVMSEQPARQVLGDQTAVKHLALHARVGRSRLRSRTEKACAEATLNAEDWWERFALEAIIPPPSSGLPVVRPTHRGMALVSADGLRTLDHDHPTEVTEATPTPWIAPQVAVITVDDEQLALVSYDEAGVLDIATNPGALRNRWRASEERRLRGGASAGPGSLWLLSRDRLDPHAALALWDGEDSGAPVFAELRLPFPTILETVSWDGTQGTLVTSWGGAFVELVRVARASGCLELHTLSRRHISGQVRALTTYRQGKRPLVIVGTSQGDVLAFAVSDDGVELVPAWVHRRLGSIRHLARGPTPNACVLAITAAGEVALLSERGRTVWSRRHPLPLKSGAATSHQGRVVLILVDLAGAVCVYQEVDEPRALAAARDALGGCSASMVEPRDRLRYEAARALQWAEAPAEGAPWIPETALARGVLLKRLCEQLDERDTLPVLTRLVQRASCAELERLVRLPSPEDPERAEGLLAAIFDRLGELAGDEAGTALPIESLVADALRGAGARLVRRAWPQDPRSAWRRLPEDLREARSVAAALLQAMRSHQRASPTVHERLLDALWIGPAAVIALPSLVAGAGLVVAEAVARSLELTGPSDDERTVGVLRSCAKEETTGKAVASVCRLLVFLNSRSAGWEDLQDLARDAVALDDQSLPAPTLHAIRLAGPYLEDRHLLEKPRDAHLRWLDELQPPAAVSFDSSWGPWLRRAHEQFCAVLGAVIDARRAAVRRRVRLRMDNAVVTRRAAGLVETLLVLSVDGDARPDVEFSLRFTPALRETSVPLRYQWTSTTVPPTLTVVGGVAPSVHEVNVVVTTVAPPECRHEQCWSWPIPGAETGDQALLERSSRLAQTFVEAVKTLGTGLHILSMDPRLGHASFVAHLLREPDTKHVALDAAFRSDSPVALPELGPESLLTTIGGRVAGGKWESPAGCTRLVVSGAEGVTRELLKAPTLIQKVVKLVEGAKSPALLWLLPPHLACEFQAAIHDPARPRQVPAELHSLNRFAPDLDEDVCQAVARIFVRGNPEALDSRVTKNVIVLLDRHLDLLLEWGRRASPLLPRAFLEKAAYSTIATRFVGLGALQLALVVLAARTRLRLDATAIMPGMVAGIDGTARPRRGKAEKYRAGRQLSEGEVTALREDPAAFEHFVVEGYGVLMKGRARFDMPEGLKALHAMVRHAADLVARTQELLRQRDVFVVVNGVAALREPFREWVRTKLDHDPGISGQRFLEDMLGGSLLELLSMEELAQADDNLAYLIAELTREACNLLVELGNLFKGKGLVKGQGEENVRRAILHLTGLDAREARTPAELVATLRTELSSGFMFEVDGPGRNRLHLVAFLPGRVRQSAHAVLRVLRRAETAIILTTFGPGSDAMAGSVEPNDTLSALTQRELKEVISSKDIPAAFWRAVRNRVGLMSFSPFQVGNQLPPGSPVFVGREAETTSILRAIDTTSYLIVGGRRIGKTSLLRHLEAQLKERRYTAIWLDAAGIGSAEKLLPGFRHAAKRLGFKVIKGSDAVDTFEETLRRVARPVLLINEVDELCRSGQDFLQRLRALAEERVCQSIFVGYHRAYVDTMDPHQPFNHWVKGRGAGKAFVLERLDLEAGHQLIDHLEREPLGLRWESEEAREQAHRLFLQRSQCIPVLLQSICQSVVEHLHRRRQHSVITLADARAVLDRVGNPVFQYIQETRLPVDGELRDRDDPIAILFADLVFAVLVKSLYLPAGQERIALPVDVDDRRYQFNVSEAHEFVQLALNASPLVDSELGMFNRRFSPEHYQRLLDGNCLTVFLSPVPGSDRRYCFTGHIYPLELDHFIQREGITIHRHISLKISDLISVLSRTSTGRTARPRD